MRWRRGRRSENLRDERSAGGLGGGFGGRGLPVGLGAGIPALVLLVLGVLFGGSILGGGGSGIPDVLDQFPGAQVAPGQTGATVDPDADLVDFVSFVLDDVQTTWEDVFRRAGQTYKPAELVLFTSSTQSACGSATSDVGPFYCPGDSTVYIDLGFFQELRNRFGAPGDFAQAYVIAHEIGHHVQNVLGIGRDVRRATEEDPSRANDLSIRQELQADCLAGVWGFSAKARGILEPGDLQEGLNAAAAIGDDRLQKQATGVTDPETWTHGSSEQRTEWFTRGFEGGAVESCDTFTTDV